MKELKCPKCGNVFQVDEADYASIVNQVKNAEFDAEITRRMSELHERYKAEEQLAAAKAENEYKSELGKKDIAMTQKEAEISKLQNELNAIEQKKAAELTLALADKDKEIAALKASVHDGDNKLKIAVMEEQRKAQENIQSKETEIARLKADAELNKQKATIQENTIKEQYELKLRTAQEEIDRIKDFKSKLSTKMIGETLEQHCSYTFNKDRMTMYPNAYFEKDNDASGGSKGDFIFRDYVDGQEYVSIMFEMKNEDDKTATKKKNENFFAELDKDRNEKKCEYAVLVTMLEPESELYNEGIVDVSYRYPKMFVVRPQFFMPIIALLSQASRKSVDYIRELEIARSQSIDVTNFEEKILKFRDAFGKNVGLAVKNHEDAISKIDGAIKTLQTIKDMFEKSNTYLTRADHQLEEDLTVRKLTYKNATMKAKFDEARKENGAPLVED